MGHDADRLTVGHRLRWERRRRFVGRTAERALFERLLTADQASFCVLWVHGPGGVGKAALCGVFADLARASGRSVVSVDDRDLEITPTGAGRRASYLTVRRAGSRGVVIGVNVGAWPRLTTDVVLAAREAA